VAEGQDLLKVEALAGSGKTTLCEFVGEILGHRKMIYLAFNKLMAEQAHKRLGAMMDSRTMDGLAYAVVKPWEIWGEKRLQRSKIPLWSLIGDALRLPPTFGAFRRGALARLVYQAVLKFCYSDDREIGPQHMPDVQLAAGEKHCLRIWAIQLWDRMVAVDQDIPVPPAQVLKWWQLRGAPLNYDVVLYDEAQDACPAFAHILQRSSALRLPIGDSHQQLYEWRGAKDIMKQMGGSTFPLTLSWRFGAEIAALSNSILKSKATPPEFLVVGSSGVSSKVRLYDRPDSYPEWPVTILARTNAQVFQCAIQIAQRGHRLHVVGDIDDLRWLLLDALRLYRGEPAQHPRLMCFPTWNDLVSETHLTGEPELRRVCEIIHSQHNTLESQLEELKRRHEIDPLRASAILATTHKVKGREWDRVMLLKDFIQPSDLSTLAPAHRDAELNILYVAVTRARRELYLPRELAAFTRVGTRGDVN
jgi:hypothetical protein